MSSSSPEVTPKTLSMIAAAVTAFLGKNVRIRSATLVPPQETVGRWARQGRVIVQSSHNLLRGR
jgi:hypothetical protein